MMKTVLVATVLLFGTSAYAQNYSVAAIPATLSKNADAILRLEEVELEVKGPGASTYKHKRVVTVLNRSGEKFVHPYAVYDKFSSLSNIKAILFDANGKKIKEYKTGDMIDQSTSSGSSIYDDNRVKVAPISPGGFPYTVEFSYILDHKGLLYFESWEPGDDFHISVERSSYTLTRNKNFSIKYKTSKGLRTDSVVSGDNVKYSWTCNNLEAIPFEGHSVGFEDLRPWMKATPDIFEFDGSTGNFNTWQNFGSWIYKLNEGGNVLPENAKAKIQSLIKDAKTKREIVTLLYNYLQQNTRYVNVSLGIGGFRPILAEKVAQSNYGDCKALSNYMKAMLNEAGIPSNLIVIGNGMPELDANFSSMNQANHMILYVPLENDPIFLECTSQHMPMGFIGYDNSDRNVLMVTDKGGKIIRTPIYKPEDNFQIRKATVNFGDDGNATVSIHTTLGNAQFEDTFGIMFTEPVEQRKSVINGNDIPAAELIDFKFEQPDISKPILTKEVSFKNAQLFTKGGNNLFLALNFFNRSESVPPKIEERKTSFYLAHYGYKDTDEIVYNLPKTYKVDFLPKDVSIDSEFGNYSIKFITQGNQITCIRSLKMTDKSFPAEKYNNYVDFYKKVYQADKLKAVLVVQ